MITKTYAWAGCVACLAIAVATSGAFAQQQQDQQQQAEQQRDQDTQRDEQDRARDQQEQDRTQQEQQRAQQQQQRSQQEQQRAQQEQQRAQQDRQRQQQFRQQAGEERWDEERMRDRQQQTRDRFPAPDSRGFGRDRQFDREYDVYGRDERRFRGGVDRWGEAGGDDAGLGVSIIGDEAGALRVIEVHPGSPAEDMGLQRGDQITHLNGQRVQSTQQFISQIRNMNPGDQVELDIRRDRDQQTVRGELESRQEALVLRGGMRGQRGQGWQQGRDTWQTGYEERGRFDQRGQARGGDVQRQLSQIERQVDQLSRDIDNLRYALRDIRQQSDRFGRETTARYDEYQYRDRDRGDVRMSERWQDEQRSRSFDDRGDMQRDRGFDSQRGQQSRQFDQGTNRSRMDLEDSPGGQIGEERLRPGSGRDDRQ